MSILADVRQYIEDAGLATGYTWRYGRMLGVDSTSQYRFIMLRQMGEGASDIHVQRINVLIMIAGETESDVQTVDTLGDEIVRLFRGIGDQGDAFRFEVVGGKNGPFFLESNKPYYEVNISAYTENY